MLGILLKLSLGNALYSHCGFFVTAEFLLFHLTSPPLAQSI